MSKGHGRPYGSKNQCYTPPQTMTIRRFRDVANGIMRDLGGEDELSTGEFQLVRRCAYISVMCEQLEAKPATELPEIALHATLTSHLARTLKVLGLKRVPKDVTPTLQTYVDAWAHRSESEEPEEELTPAPEPPPEMG
jgi:hypothetical protein